jgi:hypothetical protein
MPDLEVTDGERTFRLYSAMQHHAHVLLLCGQDDVPPGLRRWLDRVIVVWVAGRAPAGRVYLLRPDGYVAASGGAASPGALVAYLRQVFGPGRPASPGPREERPAAHRSC